MLFGVLGPLAVWTDEGEPVTVPGRLVRALLADLLLHEGRTVSADRLVDDLWPQDPPANPAGTLSAKASQLRKALGDAEPGGRDLVAARPPGYRLAVRPEAVDARRFQDLVARAGDTDDPRAKADRLTEALSLWRGPAFADFADEPFTQAAIARLEELRLIAYEDRAAARLALGDHALLAGELAGLLAAHPLRERLRAAHMRALYAAGRQSEALESFAELRTLLADELGLDPGAELSALHRSILAQDLPAAPSRARPRTNLPVPLTGLVGRSGAVSEVGARLGTDRLVTLTGPGGVGKTRLALEVAGRADGSHADGVWLVELAPLPAGTTGTTGLADLVTAVLGVHDSAAQAPLDRLVEALGGRHVLLVLDNCEHVVESAAELAGTLLRAVPGLRILATSREPLCLPGEVVWAVPPLAVPDRAEADPAALERVAAVRLFVERASAADRGFALDAGTAEPVAVLCRRLDGIPLALELAATRVRALGVHGLVDRLDDRLRLLATGHRGTPPRQQTLLAVIDWSWELLTEPERVVLRRLAVHADGCTLEAAEAVCAVEGDTLDLLARLVDRSLVVMTDHGRNGPRYRLLESVAAYCVERMREAGELEAVRARHRDHYTRLAEQAEPHLYGAGQRRWLDRLDAEAANLRGALEGPRSLRVANALAWSWFLRGRLTEARRSLEAALAHDGPAEPKARARAWLAGFALLEGDRTAWDAYRDPRADPGDPRALWFLGYLGIDTGELAASEEMLERALAAFRAADDRWGEAAVLIARAKISHVRGDSAALERDSEHAVRLFGELGDRWGMLQATVWLSGLAEMTGDHKRARDLQNEALRLGEELALWPDVAGCLAWLGWIDLQLGDYAQARENCERALRLAVEQGARSIRTLGELGLGFASRKTGDLDQAEVHLRRLVDAVEPGETPLHLPIVLVELGFAAEQRGRAAQALAHHLDALAAAATIEGGRELISAIEGVAGALAAAGEHTDAARLLGAADTFRASSGFPLAPAERGDLDRITRRARTELGEDPFTAEFTRGTELTFPEAQALATRPRTLPERTPA
ncbi:BTAD domain-containing putative transcriptional regulator [Actinocorallia populi]|uniref:BTAD domain-containing putative transcriptional regulator n=1 Tax=Actinocorallia populi TaxID=2079200 RepID=UPI000D09221E|nr:BTAD domain-containing putative transcriptional regulator [Actinocorallia populi]